MYNRIIMELADDRNDWDVYPVLQELINSRDVTKVLLVRRIENTRFKFRHLFFGASEVVRKDREHEDEALRYLNNIRTALDWGHVESEVRVLFNSTGPSLEDLAEEEGYDLIFTPATRKRGPLRWLWRNTTRRVERAGTVPVAVLKDHVHFHRKAA